MDELRAKKPGRRRAGWHEWGLCALAVFPALPKRPNGLQKTRWSPASFVPFLASRWLLSLGEVRRVGLKSEPTCSSLSVYINPRQNLHTRTHTRTNTHTQRDCCVMKFKGGWSARLRLCEETLNSHWSTEGIYFVVYSHNTCPTPSPALLTSLCAPSMGWVRKLKGDSCKLDPAWAHIADQSFSFKTKKKKKCVSVGKKKSLSGCKMEKKSDRSYITRGLFLQLSAWLQSSVSVISSECVLLKINGFHQEYLLCFS